MALSLLPVVCVDLLPWRQSGESRELAFIVRDDSQGGRRYALVGGGVLRTETINEAATRHLRETLGEEVGWVDNFDRRPDALLQYFPDDREGHGLDTRKHSVGLTYLVEISGEVNAGGEAEEVHWFALEDLPRREQFGFRQWRVAEELLEVALG